MSKKQEQQKILIQMNFPAPFISKESIEKFLNNNLNELDKSLVNWLEAFFGIPRSSFTKNILERFCKINTKENSMNIVPSIEKILKPFRYACKSFCFGLYGPSISMSAVAAESLQIILWEMNSPTIKNKKITEIQEKKIFGRKFEKLEQNRRIEILETFEFISKEQKEKFCHIRDKRNLYLHPWKEDFENEEGDACLCYEEAFSLFKEITGVKLKTAGSIEANPMLIKWMNINNAIK